LSLFVFSSKTCYAFFAQKTLFIRHLVDPADNPEACEEDFREIFERIMQGAGYLD